ncbi:MAG: hypothetical protein LBD16_00645 [Oscillospiraceae bacterium]|jgi:hypothetical protein|nr:hypothetical protein [Oscillospiraceae bacterium]
MAAYNITTEAQLRAIVSGDVVTLTNDITVAGGWNSLEVNNVTLHGDCHSIRGLDAPLFGSADLLGSENISVDKLTIYVSFTRNFDFTTLAYGGFMTTANNAAITACSVHANINAAIMNVGGIAGYLQGSTVTDCFVYGSVNGMVESGCSTGGIAGVAANSTIRSCVNQAAITGVGGPAGIVSSLVNSTIEDCQNAPSAAITVKPAFMNPAPGVFTGFGVAGGIVSSCGFSCAITGNINFADIVSIPSDSATALDGSTIIAGGIAAAVEPDEEYEDDGITISSNKNYGSITISAAGTNPLTLHTAGGVVGAVQNGTVTVSGNSSCGTISAGGFGVNFAGGIIGDTWSPSVVISNNYAGGLSISGSNGVHRILGASGNGSPVALTNNSAFADTRLTGTNALTFAPDNSAYSNQAVAAGDPQVGANRWHGASTASNADCGAEAPRTEPPCDNDGTDPGPDPNPNPNPSAFICCCDCGACAYWNYLASCYCGRRTPRGIW